MKFFTTLLLIVLAQSAFSQSIEATWTSESKDGEPIILVLMEDNSMLVKFGEDGAGFGPFYGYGSYDFDGTTLGMHMSTGEQYQYEIGQLSQEGFLMQQADSGETWEYRFQATAVVPKWALTHLHSELQANKQE